MRPILLKGHERALTKVMYNKDGDLLFSASKDNKPTVWYADTGVRLGTFNGHQGTVWDLDVTHDSSRLLTASADATVRLWDVRTGRELANYTHRGPVRAVAWAEGGEYFATAAEPFGRYPGQVAVYYCPAGAEEYDLLPIEGRMFEIPPEVRAAQLVWLNNNKELLIAYDDGSLHILDAEFGEELQCFKYHTAKVMDLQFSVDKTMIITASYDTSAKLIDATTFEVLQTYQTDRPVNAAVVSPIREHVVIGGGQDAMSVTTTAGQQGKFEARFFHMWYAEEFGRVKGHFGPINALAINPDGRSYASGGEDGYIRLHHFDPSYYAIADPVPEDFDPLEAKAKMEEAGLDISEMGLDFGEEEKEGQN